MVAVPVKSSAGVNRMLVAVNVAVPFVGLTLVMTSALPSGSESFARAAMVTLTFFGVPAASSLAIGGWFTWSKKLFVAEVELPATAREIWLSLGGCESPVL